MDYSRRSLLDGFRTQLFLIRQWRHISVSPRAYLDILHFLREGGPRILCVSLRIGNLDLFLRALVRGS